MQKLIFAFCILQNIFFQSQIFAEEPYYWFNSCSNLTEQKDWILNNAANIQDGLLRSTPSGNWCTTKTEFSLPMLTIEGMLKFSEGEGTFQMALGSGNEMIWNLIYENKKTLKGEVWKSRVQGAANLQQYPESEHSLKDVPFETWLPLSIIKKPNNLEIWLNHKMLEKIKVSPHSMPIAFKTTGLLHVECDEFEVRSFSSDTGTLDDSTLVKGTKFPEGWKQRSGVWSTVWLPRSKQFVVCQSMDTQAEMAFGHELTEGASISAKVRFENRGQVGLGLVNEKTGQGQRVLLRQNTDYGVLGETVNAGTALMSFRGAAHIFPGLWNHLKLQCKLGKIVVEVNGIQISEMESSNYGHPYLVSDGTPSALFRDIVITGISKSNTVLLPAMPVTESIKSFSVAKAHPKNPHGEFDDLSLEPGQSMVLSTMLIDRSELSWMMRPREIGGQLSLNGLDEKGQKIFTSEVDFTKGANLTWEIQPPSDVPRVETNTNSRWDLGLQRVDQKLMFYVDGREVRQVALPKDCGPLFMEWGRIKGDFSIESQSYGWEDARIFDLLEPSRLKSATKYWRFNFPTSIKMLGLNKAIQGPLGPINLKEPLGMGHQIYLQSRGAQNMPESRRHHVEWASGANTIRISTVLLDDGCEVQWSYNDNVYGNKRLRTQQIQLLAGVNGQRQFRVWVSGEPLGEALDVGSCAWNFAIKPESELSEHYWQRILFRIR